MAENAEFICRKISSYIGERLQIPVEFVCDIPWPERERLLDSGEIQICWICGLPYVWKADAQDSHIELLAAPVMKGKRYNHQPVYFSDVVVRRASDYKDFADLRGAVWAYNEPFSHSGHNLVAYHLSRMGEGWDYFDEVIESGAHQISLQMIIEGRVAASAIDSTVLEMELARRPEVRPLVRVIATLGPSPMPPFVAHRSLSLSLRRTIKDLLLRMHTDPGGRAILDEGLVERFAMVEDSFYDAIREMSRAAGTRFCQYSYQRTVVSPLINDAAL
jgi:phosphonate transport system substrate-binding protein